MIYIKPQVVIAANILTTLTNKFYFSALRLLYLKCGSKRTSAGLSLQKVSRLRRRVLTNGQKADTNYLIDQQRIEV
jgi:hypothetical protein